MKIHRNHVFGHLKKPEAAEKSSSQWEQKRQTILSFKNNPLISDGKVINHRNPAISTGKNYLNTGRSKTKKRFLFFYKKTMLLSY